jgi:toxin YoeB
MEERLKYSDKAKQDLLYWKKTNNVAVLKRIRKLLESILETPCSGIGKPEPLKYDFSGSWSRRINITDRLIYELQENNILHIYSMRGHYN